MKHKLLFGFATAAMAAVMCVGFAACGGGVDAAGVKGVEVSKEQWEAALNEFRKEDAKLTVVYQEKGELEISGKIGDKKMSFSASQDSEITYVINGKKGSKVGYEELKVSGDEEVSPFDTDDAGKTEYEEYSEITNDAIYVTKKNDDGKWERKTASTPVYAELSYVLTLGSYDDYTYNSDLKGYVKKTYDAEKDTRYTVIKFNKDGKLVAIYTHSEVKTEEDDGKFVQTSEAGYTISYEAKDVKIPSAE